MGLYAISDLHLGFNLDKPMDIFGDNWKDHEDKIRNNWISKITEKDTVLIAGDISWGINQKESLEDLNWIESLPGKKIISKGNHDYWWTTAAKMNRFFSENGFHTLELLHNNCHLYGETALCGTRGWFYEEDQAGHNEKVFRRELIRLEASLKAAGEHPKLCFLHYPPCYEGYTCPEIIALLEQYGVKTCYYGHLHGGSHRLAVEGVRGKVEYHLVAADYLRFAPKRILP